MSEQKSALDELTEYEEAIARRQQMVRTVLRWVPLALGGFILVAGGLSLLSASTGQEAEIAEVNAIVAEDQTAAEDAEASFQQTYAQRLDEASNLSVERLAADGESMRSMLVMLFSEEGDITGWLDEAGVEEPDASITAILDEGVPELDDAGAESTPQLDRSGVVPVLTGISGTEYSYVSTFTVVDAAAEPQVSETDEEYQPALAYGVVVWTVDDQGQVSDLSLHFTPEPTNA